MNGFRIYTDFDRIPIVVDNSKTVRFDKGDFRTIFRDRYIEITWNPLWNQPTFKIIRNYKRFVRGGYEILNNEETGVMSFQYKQDDNDTEDNRKEYYFGSKTGEAADINMAYSFIGNWNRAKLWLASLFDKDFPYYDISLTANSNKMVAVITKTDLDD